VAAAAIQTGAAFPDEIFFCENGSYKVGQTRIGEAADHKFGWLSLENIIAKSSNIGAIKVAEKLGKNNLYSQVRNFGFGDKLGIDLPGETPGQLREPSHWSNLSLSSISFGHEIAVTPIQILAAISAIANGGKLMLPHVTKAVMKNGAVVKTTKPALLKQVISEKTSRQMVEILKTAVARGTGIKAAVDGFEVAGKTGTAQKIDPETQAYSKTDFLASFVGFVPADAPRIAILVMIDEPKNVFWGGEVAAPVFREIARQALRHLHTPSKEERVFILDRA
jgi:cell division protein FtsI (penicillin-binding protein 3)